jgi:Family of unknown function (DUF5758)
MTKQQIIHRYSGAVLFECELPAGLDSGLAMRYALGKACAAGANLAGASLRGANLADAKGAELAIAATRILPDGELIGWKKCHDGVIVRLRIPVTAKRSHAFGRKCRAEFVEVMEVIGEKIGISIHDKETEYVAGTVVRADKFDDNWQNECGGGIHFYITRLEAENHN